MPPKRKATTATAKSNAESEEVTAANDLGTSETTSKRAKVTKSTTIKAAKGKGAVKKDKKNKVETNSETEEQLPEPAPIRNKRGRKPKVEIIEEAKKPNTRRNNKLQDCNKDEKNSETEEELPEPEPAKKKRGVKAKAENVKEAKKPNTRRNNKLEDNSKDDPIQEESDAQKPSEIDEDSDTEEQLPEHVPVKNKRGGKAKAQNGNEAKKTNTRKDNKKEDLKQKELDAQNPSDDEKGSETEEPLPEPVPVKNKRGGKARGQNGDEAKKTKTRKDKREDNNTEDLKQEEIDTQNPSGEENDSKTEEQLPDPVPVKNKRGAKVEEAKKPSTRRNNKLEDNSKDDPIQEESDAQKPSEIDEDSDTEEQLPEPVPVKNKRGGKAKAQNGNEAKKTNTRKDNKKEDLKQKELDAQNPSDDEKGSETEEPLPEPVPIKNKRGGKVEETKKPIVQKIKLDDDDNKDDPVQEEPDVVPAKKTKEKKQLINKVNTNWETIDFKCSKLNKDGKSHNIIISAWNIGGLRSWVNKECHEFLTHEKPDIICLQEVKCANDKIPEEIKNLENYQKYWISSENNDGYAGVGLLTVPKPKNVTYGINNEELDAEGRCITAEYDKFFLVNAYVPNAGRKLVTLPKRLKWNEAFKKYINKLDEQKPVIICGDMNVSHNEIDLARPKSNTKNAGFTQEEREGMTELLNSGYVDVFRELYPSEKDVYSFWSYMNNARAKNIGWRLDYFLASERVVSRVCDVTYRSEVLGSDHCPLTLFMNM